MAAEVHLIAWTHFAPPPEVPWSTDADGGAALAEFAGRSCYETWDKPVAATATNAGFLRHLIEVGHLSVIEHASATFYVTGVSRALSHELVRHRHFSFSELSARHVPAAVVEPLAIAADPELHKRFTAAIDAGAEAYHALLDGLDRRIGDTALGRKQARQAALAVLPAATETHIVITGNFRTWRHFIGVRATEHADVEIRALAVECLRHLQALAPSAFADFTIATLDDGTPTAASPFVAEG